MHPYHHQVIGDKADLLTISREDLYRHYRNYYLPNNAVMAVAGDFDTKDMLNRIRELFDKIPPGSPPARIQRNEPDPTGELRLSVEGPGETNFLQVAYRFPHAQHEDFFALAVLDSLLAGPSNLNMFGGGISNKTSRIYRALVDGEYAVSASGGASVTVDPYLYTFTLTVHPNRKPQETLEALDEEIRKVQEVMVSREEITRAIKQARAIFAYGSENITNQAFWMGFAEMFATYDWFSGYLKRLSKITPADVQRVAREYFQPRRRVVGTYLANGAGS